jgi:hypothetical protein
MSLVDVRSYFSTIASGLGYSKHYDGFATNNIPSSRFEKTYHVQAFEFGGSAQNQTVVDISAPVTVRLYFKGYQDVDLGISKATNAGYAFIRSALASENRLTQTNVKNVLLENMSVEPYASTNDNYIVCVLTFRTYLYLQIC